MELVLIASMVALAMKAVDLVKNLRARAWDAALTQLVVWASGVAVVFLGSATVWAHSLDVQGVALDDLNAASKVFLGLCLLSAGAVANDWRKAIDGTDSARTPTLLDQPPH